MRHLKDSTSIIQDTRPILVTGSHRSGSTWVGKMLNLSWQTYYLSEVFHPQDGHLGRDLLKHWFLYVPANQGVEHELFQPVDRILSLNFNWPNRKGLRSYLPSRLEFFKYSRQVFGLPRPIMKDPIAVLSAEWLAVTFNMNVICLIRHPAAFVASLREADWKFGFDQLTNQPQLMEDWLYPFADQLIKPPESFVKRASLVWLCLYHVLTAYIKRHPEWMVWRLEDISQDPINRFEQIFSHLGLNYTQRIRQRVWEYSKPSNPAKASSKNLHLIRRDSLTAQNRWRKLLTADEITAIRQITEPVSHEYYVDQNW